MQICLHIIFCIGYETFLVPVSTKALSEALNMAGLRLTFLVKMFRVKYVKKNACSFSNTHVPEQMKFTVQVKKCLNRRGSIT